MKGLTLWSRDKRYTLGPGLGTAEETMKIEDFSCIPCHSYRLTSFLIHFVDVSMSACFWPFLRTCKKSINEISGVPGQHSGLLVWLHNIVQGFCQSFNGILLAQLHLGQSHLNGFIYRTVSYYSDFMAFDWVKGIILALYFMGRIFSYLLLNVSLPDLP